MDHCETSEVGLTLIFLKERSNGISPSLRCKTLSPKSGHKQLQRQCVYWRSAYLQHPQTVYQQQPTTWLSVPQQYNHQQLLVYWRSDPPKHLRSVYQEQSSTRQSVHQQPKHQQQQLIYQRSDPPKHPHTVYQEQLSTRQLADQQSNHQQQSLHRRSKSSKHLHSVIRQHQSRNWLPVHQQQLLVYQRLFPCQQSNHSQPNHQKSNHPQSVHQ
jgi:hypothetical protein